MANIKHWLYRNEYCFEQKEAKHKKVNLEHSKINNIGDTLSPVLVDYLLDKKGIDKDKTVKKTKHLLAVGSIIGRGRFDATIWGSGILKLSIIKNLKHQKLYRKYDIRAVRGPKTAGIMKEVGFKCPEVYGDPAVLMPFIYTPANINKKYKLSLILHHRTVLVNDPKDAIDEYHLYVPKETMDKYDINMINPETSDYKAFIDAIVSSERIVSSSLHGIILAECYGVPTTFLNFGMDDQQTKFYDWYLSTNREMKFEKDIKKAIEATPMELPDLSKMQKDLEDSFPYDLWEN